jgi:uncharacterized protein
MNVDLAQFKDQNYLNLESFRKNGQGVKTPVWFAESEGVFYVYTEADSYKVKRIRGNPNVRIAPCDMRGNLKGQWREATARILDDAESKFTHELLIRKYGIQKRIADLFAKIRGHERAEIAIRLV